MNITTIIPRHKITLYSIQATDNDIAATNDEMMLPQQYKIPPIAEDVPIPRRQKPDTYDDEPTVPFQAA